MKSLARSLQPANTPGIFELDFCTLEIVSENTAEILINQGVEVSRKMVEHSIDVLRSMLSAPFCLLMNERNSHSYDFQAQTALGAAPELLALAMVAYTPATDVAARCLKQLPRETSWPMAVFPRREDALTWLKAMQSDVLAPKQAKYFEPVGL